MNLFLSYSRKDYDFANFLYNIVNLYKDRLHIWMDEDIDAGETWQQIINQEIDRADIFIAIFTEEFDNSKACRSEFRRFLKRKESNDSLLIIPIKIDDYASYDISKFNEPQLATFNWVDFSDWQIRGDRVFIKELLPILLPFDNTTENINYNYSLGFEIKALREVLRDYKNKVSNFKQSKYLISLVTAYTQNNNISTIDRAELLAELSELFLRRGEWKKVLEYNDTALILLKSHKIESETDRVNILLGHIFARLSVAYRKLKTNSPKEFLFGALAHFDKLSNRVLSSDFKAQVYRELGTYYLLKDDLDKADKAFEESKALLRCLPSQRGHFIQAHIKKLQLSLFSKKFKESQIIVKQLESIFEVESKDVTIEIIYCHYLMTRVLSLILMKESITEIKSLLEIHKQIALKHGFRNEIIKNRIFTFSYLILWVLPSRVVIWGLRFYFR